LCEKIKDNVVHYGTIHSVGVAPTSTLYVLCDAKVSHLCVT